MQDFSKEHPLRWGMLYHQRSQVESEFHSIKTMLGERLYEKTDSAKINKLYLRVICHNITHLIKYNVLNDVDVNFDNYDYVKYREHLKESADRVKLNRIEEEIMREEDIRIKKERAERRRLNKLHEKQEMNISERQEWVKKQIIEGEESYFQVLMRKNEETENERLEMVEEKKRIALEKLKKKEENAKKKEEKMKKIKHLDDFQI